MGARDVNRTLSVAEGSYFIRGRGSSHLLEGTIIANRGQSVEVADALLDRIDYARLVRKGGEYRGSASGIQAGYSVRSALENEAALCHGGFIGYSVVLPALTVSPRIEACRGSFRNERLSATVDSLGLVLRAAHAWDSARWFVELGAEAGGTLHQQRFEAKGRAPTRDTFGGNFGLGVGVGAILGQGFTLFAESGFESHLFHLQHTQSGERAIEASFALRQRFGVGKIW